MLQPEVRRALVTGLALHEYGKGDLAAGRYDKVGTLSRGTLSPMFSNSFFTQRTHPCEFYFCATTTATCVACTQPTRCRSSESTVKQQSNALQSAMLYR